LNVFAKDLERATRRKKKIEREHLIAAVKIGTIVISAVVAYVPQLKVVASILNGLSASMPVWLPANPTSLASPGTPGSHEETSLIAP